MATTKTANPVTTVSDAFSASIKQSQDLFTSGINAWAEVAGKAFPKTGVPTLGFGDQLPSAKELVDASYGFLEELVAAQKELAYKLLEVTEAGEAN